MHKLYVGQAVRHFIYGDGKVQEIYKNGNEEICFDVYFPGLGKVVTIMDAAALTPSGSQIKDKIDENGLQEFMKNMVFGAADKELNKIIPTKDTTTKSKEEQVPQKMYVSKEGIDTKKKEHLQKINKTIEEMEQAVKPVFGKIKQPYDGVAHHLDIVMGLNKLYAQKNADYGDSFHNTYMEEGMAMARIRLSDKLNRFKALTRNGNQQVKDESVRDTLLDLANYAILTVMELDREAGKNEPVA